MNHAPIRPSTAPLHSLPRRPRSWFLPALLAIAAASGAAPACVAAGGDDATGGETHFFRICDEQANDCPGELQCICSMCTLPCGTGSACDAPASCVTPSEQQCPGGTSSNFCARTCSGDADCVGLGPDAFCLDQLCRVGQRPDPSQGGQPSGGTPGAGGLPASAGAPTSGGSAAVCEPTPLVTTHLALLGDSFFATSHEIPDLLAATATSEGYLTGTAEFIDASRLPSNALAWNGTGIADQYAVAKETGPVSTVIMNGGGADILLGTCDAPETCALLPDAAAALGDLLAQMATDGVQNVIFAGYPDPVPADAKARMDVLRPLLEQRCADSPVPCLWVDLRETFGGYYDTYILADGLNPTTEGSQASASAIWDAMALACIVP